MTGSLKFTHVLSPACLTMVTVLKWIQLFCLNVFHIIVIGNEVFHCHVLGVMYVMDVFIDILLHRHLLVIISIMIVRSQKVN